MRSRIFSKVLLAILAFVMLLSAGGVYATWVYSSGGPQEQSKDIALNMNEFMYYDEVVITNVVTVSNTLTAEATSRELPASLKSTITGKAGQKIVYEVSAHNYSKTKSFVYAGASYDANKISISASLDADNLNEINANVSANYYEGVAIAPGEDFIFYVTYTLTEDFSAGEFLANYLFKQIIYSVTYLNNNKTFAVEHITNNQTSYSVRSGGPQHQSLVFAGWVNANAIVVNAIPAGNTNNYTLSASWENVYLIIFADANGQILYEEQFTDSSTKLSSEGQAKVKQRSTKYYQT